MIEFYQILLQETSENQKKDQIMENSTNSTKKKER